MTALPRVRVTVRAGGPDSPAPFMLFSLLAHTGLIAATLVGASLVPARQALPPDPGFFVSLAAGGGEPARAEPAPRPTAPEPEPAPPEPPAPARPKAVEIPDKPKDPEPLPPKPTRPAPSAPAETPPAPAAGSAPGEAGTAPGIPGAPPGPGVPGGQGEVTSLDIEDFEHAWYTARVVSRLKATWRRPHAPDEAVRSATVAFSIHRDGSVSEVRVDVPSGLEPLDLSAMRAVFDAAPLPPLPAQWRKADVLTARIVFELKPE